jgi:hypothetical protein
VDFRGGGGWGGGENDLAAEGGRKKTTMAQSTVLVLNEDQIKPKRTRNTFGSNTDRNLDRTSLKPEYAVKSTSL